MITVSRNRIEIAPGHIIMRTHDPLWYEKYDPWIRARGQVLWVNKDAAMVCVEWTYINGQQPLLHDRFTMLGSYDLDRYDTHYGVLVTPHSELLFPVWLTSLGLEYWSNIMFRHMH
ncbi:MAG TPA: hypothetical protein VIY48_10545 [Candidatus Paceibacterota bacterium]